MATTKKPAQGHKINLDYVFKKLDGTDMINDKKKPVTARMVIQECLVGDNPDSRPTPEEKVKAGELAFRKLPMDDPEFTADELKVMETRCGTACITPVWYQLKALLDGKVDPLCD